jgi:hypothetical protein
MAMRRDRPEQPLFIAIGSLLLLSSITHAGTLTYGADAGVAETDNVTLVPSDKVSQTMGIADLDLDYTQQTARLNADVKGDFTYIDYLQGAYHDQLLGRLDGDATLVLVPDRLTWTVQENYGQMALNPFTPVTPVNIETVNYLATGPNLNLRLGGLSFLDFSARVARAQYETSPFTNDRVSGSGAWGMQLSALSSISLKVDTQRVLFENTLVNTDFDRTNLFLNYELQGSRTEISTDLGLTKVSADGASTNGSLVTVTLSRTLSQAAKLMLTAGHILTDATSSFSGAQSGASGAIATAPAAITSANYTSNYAALGWQYQRNRTTLGLTGRWEKDTYAGEPLLNHTLKTAEFRVGRQVTRSVAAELSGRVYETDYGHALVAPENGSPRTTTGTVSAGVTWRHGRGLEIKLGGEHTVYSVGSGGMGYHENRGYITVGYRPLARQ